MNPLSRFGIASLFGFDAINFPKRPEPTPGRERRFDGRAWSNVYTPAGAGSKEAERRRKRLAK